MDVLCCLSFLTLCLITGSIVSGQTVNNAKLIERIDALELRERESRLKIERLDRRLNGQSRIVQSQAEQIKSLQEMLPKDKTWIHQIHRMTRSNTNKINMLQRILIRSNNVNHNVKNDNLDTNTLAEVTRESESDKTRHMAQAGMKKVRSNASPLIKRQEMAGISFSAYLDHDIDPGTHQTIKFNQVIINEGNGYNTNTGVFTCPEAGVYMFSFFIGQRADTTDTNGIYVELMINSQNTVDAVVDVFHRTQDLQGGNTVIKRLKQGDVVWIDALGGHAEGRSALRISTFSGVYLYP